MANYILSDIKAKYNQAVSYAKNTVEDAEKVKNIIRLPDDYHTLDDYEQAQQENSDALYKANIYLIRLQELKNKLAMDGINV